MEQGKTIGIFGGSFNPVHRGHLMLAQWLLHEMQFDSILFVVSPSNPLKHQPDMLPEQQRLAMVKLALEGHPRLEACDIEFAMPRPSYTINTLRELSCRYPGYKFKLIIGADNWQLIDKWRAADEIIRDYGIVIYPRPGYHVDPGTLPEGVTLSNAPVVDVSSTMLRKVIPQWGVPDYFLTPEVSEYIKNNKLYNYGNTLDNQH
ncbi:MAG: nicotinate-nucleotide adenylyltransferase [Bacteroidales bacterium]|nr:nicotinate-nucleotide adenylyltransferase [Bacteroidales bacterium]MBD5246053.1 nicotinate-nucleotide adenylyltransferase [Barnesiella sp.]